MYFDIKEKNKIINYDVPLNESHINANIKINILEENKMRELGFTDYCKDTWYYCTRVINKKRFIVTFNLSINKQNPKDFTIDVLDEAYLQPYDYQLMLKNESPNKTCIQVHERVQEIMNHLIVIGIIEGYNLGDYI